MIEGILHSPVKERGLQPAPAQLRNRSRTGKQCNPIMHAQRTGSTRFAVELGEKTETLLGCRRYDTVLRKKFEQFRVFVSPALRVYIGPERGFVRLDNAHSDIAVNVRRRLAGRTTEYAAELDGPVVAGAKQVQCSHARQRAHFMKCGRPAFKEEFLDRTERGRV